jgi:hypothetical protein
MVNHPLAMMDKGKQEQVIELLLGFMSSALDRSAGFDKVLDALGNDPSPETVAKFLRTTMKVVREQDVAMVNLAQIAVTYIGGESFTRDAAVIANKTGFGKEALQKMFADKMNGRN